MALHHEKHKRAGRLLRFARQVPNAHKKKPDSFRRALALPRLPASQSGPKTKRRSKRPRVEAGKIRQETKSRSKQHGTTSRSTSMRGFEEEMAVGDPRVRGWAREEKERNGVGSRGRQEQATRLAFQLGRERLAFQLGREPAINIVFGGCGATH